MYVEFIGLPGCGKSTIAREVISRLNSYKHRKCLSREDIYATRLSFSYKLIVLLHHLSFNVYLSATLRGDYIRGKKIFSFLKKVDKVDFRRYYAVIDEGPINWACRDSAMIVHEKFYGWMAPQRPKKLLYVQVVCDENTRRERCSSRKLKAYAHKKKMPYSNIIDFEGNTGRANCYSNFTKASSSDKRTSVLNIDTTTTTAKDAATKILEIIECNS